LQSWPTTNHTCSPSDFEDCVKDTSQFNTAYHVIELAVRNSIKYEEEDERRKKAGKEGKEGEERDASVIGQYDGADDGDDEEPETGKKGRKEKGGKERKRIERESSRGCDNGKGSKHCLDPTPIDESKKKNMAKLRARLVAHYKQPIEEGLRVSQVNDRVINATYKATEHRGISNTGMFVATGSHLHGSGLTATSFPQWMISRKYRPKEVPLDSDIRSFFTLDMAASSAGPILEAILALSLENTSMRESMKYVFKKKSLILLIEQAIFDVAEENPYATCSKIIALASEEAIEAVETVDLTARIDGSKVKAIGKKGKKRSAGITKVSKSKIARTCTSKQANDEELTDYEEEDEDLDDEEDDDDYDENDNWDKKKQAMKNSKRPKQLSDDNVSEEEDSLPALE
jgi:hypothetical protein